jgi:hypothetical protein
MSRVFKHWCGSWIRDKGSIAFLTPGSGIRDGKVQIRDGKNPDPGTEIRGKHPGSYFRKINNNFLIFGFKIP